MKINIVATHMDLTLAITDYVKKKLNSLEKLIDTSGDKEVLTKVEIGKESTHHQKGNIFVMEAHLLYRKETYTTKVRGEDLYAVIDEVKDGLSRELKATKDRRSTRVKAGARKIKELLHAAT